MMNYEIFKEVVAEKILDYMGAAFQDYEVDIRPVQKVNRTLDGLNLTPPANVAGNVSPTIYINNMYEHYQACEDLSEVMKSAAECMGAAFKEKPQVDVGELLASAEDKVVMTLINTEQNKEMLANVPNRPFQDLSIIYRVIVNEGMDGIASSMVTHQMAAHMGMNEEQLFAAAVKNTKVLLPPTVKNMNEVIKDMFLKDGMPPEIAEMMIGEIPPEQSMYVISNERGINGAASMLYEDNLHKLAEQLETDLYIMPSSVHEVIAVSTDMGDPNELAQMVNEVNMDQVSLDERLSNQVYHYDKDLRKLSLATDTPNKRLDGVVAESKLIYEAKEQSR